jgi:hypothetical protein
MKGWGKGRRDADSQKAPAELKRVSPSIANDGQSEWKNGTDLSHQGHWAFALGCKTGWAATQSAVGAKGSARPGFVWYESTALSSIGDFVSRGCEVGLVGSPSGPFSPHFLRP